MDSSLEFSSSLSSLPARCRTFKIILVGDSGVGKTCLTHRFCTGEFASRTEATIGVDFRERFVDIEGEKIKLQLWDTAGQERFRKSMVQHYYRSVHAVLFVYDVSCPASFWGLPVWLEECRQNSVGQDIPRFLVGNKSDLRYGPHPVGANGHVTHEQALKFAEAHRMTLFETSAKSHLNKEMNGRKGQRDRGRGTGETQYHQDNVEAIVLALAVRLKRQKRATVLETRENNWPFKLPAKKRPEKSSWACTC